MCRLLINRCYQVQTGQEQDIVSIQALLGQILAQLSPIQSSQPTLALQEIDNTTKGEKEGQ